MVTTGKRIYIASCLFWCDGIRMPNFAVFFKWPNSFFSVKVETRMELFFLQKDNQNFLMVLHVPFVVVLCMCPSIYKNLGFWNQNMNVTIKVITRISIKKKSNHFCICNDWLKLSWNFSKGSHMIHLYIRFIDWAEMLILPYISLIMVLRVYYFLFLRPFKPVKLNFILLKYLMHLNQNMGGGGEFIKRVRVAKF